MDNWPDQRHIHTNGTTTTKNETWTEKAGIEEGKTNHCVGRDGRERRGWINQIESIELNGQFRINWMKEEGGWIKSKQLNWMGNFESIEGKKRMDGSNRINWIEWAISNQLNKNEWAQFLYYNQGRDIGLSE